MFGCSCANCTFVLLVDQTKKKCNNSISIFKSPWFWTLRHDFYVTVVVCFFYSVDKCVFCFVFFFFALKIREKACLLDRRHPSACPTCPSEPGAVRTGVLLLQTSAVEAGSGGTKAAAASAERTRPSLLACYMQMQVQRSVKTRFCHTLERKSSFLFLFVCFCAKTCPGWNGSRLSKSE